MAVTVHRAEELDQDKDLGRLVVTRIADPTGRWQRVREVHEALLAQGIDVLTVEWGDAGEGTEVVVTAAEAVTDQLTAMPVPPDLREALAEKIAGATSMDELKAILTDDLLPRVRFEGEHR